MVAALLEDVMVSSRPSIVIIVVQPIRVKIFIVTVILILLTMV